MTDDEILEKIGRFLDTATEPIQAEDFDDFIESEGIDKSRLQVNLCRMPEYFQ